MVDDDLTALVKDHYRRINEYEREHKGTWEECRVSGGPHGANINEYGWCERHKYPSDRCNVVRNGDAYICRYHNRTWSTGICPGLRGPLG
jgi:hypothetical protein